MKSTVIVFLVARAAYALDASAEAKAVAETYRAMRDFSCSVVLVATDPNFGEGEEAHGALWFSGDRFRFEIGGDVYVSDGETRWSYVASEKQATVEQAGGADWSQPQEFLSRFDERFAADSSRVAGGGFTLWLSAMDRAAYVRNMELRGSRGDHLVRSAILTTTDGQMLRYTLSSFRVDRGVGAGRFAFDPPPDARVVDLRTLR